MRPGVMAPPDLYEQPARPGLTTPGPEAAPVDLRVFLWVLAAVLATVVLCLELVPE